MPYPEPPPSFLKVLVHDLTNDPSICTLCAGYETGKWRGKAFADHTMEWLPEFCLSAEELEDFRPGTAVALLRKAARLVYQTDKYQLRGEFGEIFLHIALRQVHKSIPAISKIYWKDSVNNTVKGYDAVHVVEAAGRLELWLGEVKFYNDADRAISDVIKELALHTASEYLRNEFMLITNKLEKNASHYAALSKLLDPNTSLDEVFDAVCIPILMTYDSDALKLNTKGTKDYVQAIEAETKQIRARFFSKLPTSPFPVKLHLFVIPLNTKSDLISYLDTSLKGFQ